MAEPRPGPVMVAVGGGKGGVGKSFIAANLALALARREAVSDRVVAVDLDFGGSNLNLLLGEPLPRAELGDFLDGRARDLDAIAQPTRVPRLRYVAGTFDMVTAVDPIRDRKLDLVRALVGLDARWVVLDLPAGSAPATLDFFFLGDVKLVVLNPEETAFSNAYGFLKNYLLRRLLTEFRDRPEVVAFILGWYREEPAPEERRADRSVTTMATALAEEFPALRAELDGILRDDTPLLVLNRTRGRREAAYLDRFQGVVETHLGLACRTLGVIHEDRRVRQAVRDGMPFLVAHPRHRITRDFEEWAERLSLRARIP
ncbi:MAG: P-loop NTPase [Gemmatimonadota bacterium]